MTIQNAISTHLSRKASHIKVSRGWGKNEAISFVYGFPAPELLPNDLVLSATDTALHQQGEWPLQYAGTPGSNGLRDTLIQKLARDQKITATRENLLLTAGSSQAISYICELLLDPGDVVLSEAPTFLGTVRMMKNMGVDIEGVPLDENGVRVDALEAILKRLKAVGKRAKMFYVIPTFQNPSGVTTTLERRQRIVELAREYDFVILEDDAYYDLRFAGDPLPPLYALEGGARTFYVGTFSKILSPGLRLGFVVANEDVISHLEALKPEGGASPFAMAVAWEFCKNGGLDANIAKLRAAYKRRCETMQDALTEFMPTGVTWTQPQGGFFIWVTLPDYMDAREMDAAVRAKGVDYLPGAACFFDGSGNNTLRLAFSYAAEDKLAEGIQAIADCVRERVRRSDS